jgi:stearoyl-CoA desaturase (delta-9 desaturase)
MSIYRRLGAIPWALCHLVTLGAIVTGVSLRAAVLFVAFYCLRAVGVTVAYHRYFSHRTFRTSRWFQFVLALVAETTAQKGVLWYASHHRHHHRHADTERDLHSPAQRGLWYAHIAWIFDGTDEMDLSNVPDLTKYPELRFIDRHWLLPPFALALFALVTAGASGVCFGFFGSLIATWHLTYAINSICHRYGSRPFATRDESRNHALLGLLMFGEGWHNNHHAYPGRARLGVEWWQLDIGFVVIRFLSWVGLIWDVREPSSSTRARRLLA